MNRAQCVFMKKSINKWRICQKRCFFLSAVLLGGGCHRKIWPFVLRWMVFLTQPELVQQVPGFKDKHLKKHMKKCQRYKYQQMSSMFQYLNGWNRDADVICIQTSTEKASQIKTWPRIWFSKETTRTEKALWRTLCEIVLVENFGWVYLIKWTFTAFYKLYLQLKVTEHLLHVIPGQSSDEEREKLLKLQGGPSGIRSAACCPGIMSIRILRQLLLCRIHMNIKMGM